MSVKAAIDVAEMPPAVTHPAATPACARVDIREMDTHALVTTYDLAGQTYGFPNNAFDGRSPLSACVSKQLCLSSDN